MNSKQFTPRILGVALALFLISTGQDSLAQSKKKNKKNVEQAVQEAVQTVKETVAEITLTDPVKGASVEGITEYTLQNGMKVLLFPDPSQQTITVNITYLVGSRHEGYGETGMAHLLEHMVFKGSTDHIDIPKELSDHGARPNGTTWLDRTNYFETFNATEDNLKWALDLESDRMVNSFIKKEDLESEYTVVRNEFEMGENNPLNILMQRITSAAYMWHNYGNSTIGSREDLERVPIDKLKDFYKKYYQPDNSVLIVAGKFDPESTLKLVNEYFGVIPKPKRELTPTYTKEPAQDTERNVILKRVGDVQYLGALYHVPPGTHPDYPAIDVFTDVIANEPNGPVYKALVDSKLAAAQFGFSRALKDPGFNFFGAVVPKDLDIEETKKVFLETLNAAQNRNFTEEEVKRAKTQTSKYLEQVTRNSEAFAKMLSEYIAQGDWRTFFLFRDGVEQVTPEDVNRIAQKYFKPSNRTVGMFVPTDEPDRVHIDEAPNVEMLVKDYKGREVMAQGEAFDPSTANIDKNTHTGTLSNGMKYSLLNKSTRGDAVSANITLRIGDEKSLSNIGIVDNLTADMLMNGTKSLSRTAFKDSLDALKSSVSINGGGSTVNISINSTKESLPIVLSLVEDALKNPAFDEKEFSNLKTEMKASYESQLSDPMAKAGQVYSKTMSPYPKGDVRYVPTIEERLEMLDGAKLENLKAFHAKMYGAGSGTASIVGAFNEAAIIKQLEDQFGTWNSEKAYERLTSPYVPNPVTQEAINTPDKANAMFLAGINLPMKDDNPDYAALYLGNYLLGGGFLNSRLAVRIRQKEGISYGVGSQLSVPSLDNNAMFTTYAIYAPENSAKLQEAFLEEINKVRNEGFTAEEIAKAKEGLLQSRQVSRAKDNELASKLNGYAYLNRSMAFDQKFEDQLDALTLEEVNNAFRKYIEPSKLTIIKAGDFEKKFAEKPADEKTAPAKVSGGN